MAIINGVLMQDFKKTEFPEDPEKYAHVSLLQSTQNYRTILGEKFYISLANGALARFDGRMTSMHRILFDVDGKIYKLSKAIDGFPDCDIFKAWTIAIGCGEFNGIGVYFDTKNNHGNLQPMLHLDKRINPLIWYRDKGVYSYPHHSDFFRRLLKLFIDARS